MSKRKINSAYYSKQVSKRSPYVEDMKKAVKLYEESKIEREDTLRKIMTLLKSRGEKSNQQGVELLNKYTHIEPAKGKIHRQIVHEQIHGITAQQRKRRDACAKVQNYFVKGYVNTTSKYSRTRAGETKIYDKEYHDKNPLNKTIPAKSKQDAIAQFNQQAHDAFNRSSGGPQYVAGGASSIHKGGSDDFVENYS